MFTPYEVFRNFLIKVDTHDLYRSTMLSETQTDFVECAESKSLPQWVIWTNYRFGYRLCEVSWKSVHCYTEIQYLSYYQNEKWGSMMANAKVKKQSKIVYI